VRLHGDPPFGEPRGGWLYFRFSQLSFTSCTLIALSVQDHAQFGPSGLFLHSPQKCLKLALPDSILLTSLNGSSKNSSVPITSWKFCRANRCDRRCSSLHACASATMFHHVYSRLFPPSFHPARIHYNCTEYISAAEFDLIIYVEPLRLHFAESLLGMEVKQTCFKTNLCLRKCFLIFVKNGVLLLMI